MIRPSAGALQAIFVAVQVVYVVAAAAVVAWSACQVTVAEGRAIETTLTAAVELVVVAVELVVVAFPSASCPHSVGAFADEKSSRIPPLFPSPPLLTLLLPSLPLRVLLSHALLPV